MSLPKLYLHVLCTIFTSRGRWYKSAFWQKYFVVITENMYILPGAVAEADSQYTYIAQQSSF